jgi:hypothetical protein
MLHTGFRLPWLCHRALQQQFPPEPMHLRCQLGMPARRQRRERLGQGRQPRSGLTYMGAQRPRPGGVYSTSGATEPSAV